MQVFGPSSVQSSRAITPNLQTSSVRGASTPTKIDTVDQLELSGEAQRLMQVQQAPELRADRVAEIRAQIQAGKYESLEKVSVAVDRLLNELA
jgi:negative regulator of flagellin synthesis FlgM